MLQCRNLEASGFSKKVFQLATSKRAWFARRVLAVIAQLDGSNVLLFHVEHCSRMWKARVRPAGGQWGEEYSSQAESLVVPLVDFTVPVEAEWCYADGAGAGEWQAGVPHEFGAAECDFRMRVAEPFVPDHGDFRICALVRGHPSVWVLDLPRRRIADEAPEIFSVRGVSVCRGVGQVLREAREFQCQDGPFTVLNSSPSQVALLRVPFAMPRELPFFGLFAVKAGRLSDEEIELLQKEAPPWQE